MPKQHYKKFLDECVQEELDTIVNNRILEVYVKTIKQIIEESPLLFVKALMCIDKKINPSSMRPYEQQALIVCASQFLEGKKKVQYLDDSVYKLFDEIINNGTKRILELSDDYKERQNMFEATEKEVKDLRKEYPKGTRVVLVQMDDTQAPPVGTKGTVLGVDDIGSLLMAWDNGCGLNVVYGEDEMKKINDSMNEYNI